MANGVTFYQKIFKQVKAEEILKCGEQMPKIGVFAVTEGLL
jgi:hypothetical protein